MRHFSNLLVVLGVCLGALGASGLHTAQPTSAEASAERERLALPLFVMGALSLGAGGLLGRRSRRAGDAHGGELHTAKATYARTITAIRDIVVELDEGKELLDPEEIRQRIASLMAEEYFDLTAKSDDLIRLVGFNDYARVWEGIAIAERLLNRCWSMITDGHAEEALRELPHARKGIEQAAAAVASI